MASKKDLKLGKSSFDSDLDLPDLKDLDFDSLLQTDSGKRRKPVEKITKGFISGAKSTAIDKLKDTSFLKRTVKNFLPEKYGSVVDAVDTTAKQTSSLYNDVIRDVKPSMQRFTTAADKLIPAEKRRLKKIAEKAKQLSGASSTNYSNSTSPDQLRQQGIDMTLAGVFDNHKTQDNMLRATERAEARLRYGLEDKRFQENFGVLSQINANVSRMAQYNDRVNAAYQRKMLELTMRGYLLQADMADTSRKFYAMSIAQQDAIKTNTALPEFVKLRQSERFREILRTKFSDNIQKGLFGSGDYIEHMFTGIRKKAMAAAGKAKNAFISGADMMDESRSMRDSGISIDGHEVAGSIAGGAAADGIIERLASAGGRWFRGKYGGKDSWLGKKAAQHGKWAVNPRGAIGRLIENAINSKHLKRNWEDGELKSLLKDLARSGLYSIKEAKPDMYLGASSGYKGLLNPAVFDQSTRKSIVEIIPGYLSRIFRELQVMRTGDEKTDLTVYDHNKDRFVSNTRMKIGLRQGIRKSAGGRVYRDRLNDAMTTVVGDGKLSAGAKEALQRKLTDLAFEGKQGDVKDLTSDSFYKGMDSAHAAEIRNVVNTNFYKNGEVDKERDYDISRRIGALGGSITDARGHIETLVNTGHGKALKDLGVIRYTPSGLLINTEAYKKLLHNERIGNYEAGVSGGNKGFSVAGPTIIQGQSKPMAYPEEKTTFRQAPSPRGVVVEQKEVTTRLDTIIEILSSTKEECCNKKGVQEVRIVGADQAGQKFKEFYGSSKVKTKWWWSKKRKQAAEAFSALGSHASGMHDDAIDGLKDRASRARDYASARGNEFFNYSSGTGVGASVRNLFAAAGNMTAGAVGGISSGLYSMFKKTNFKQLGSKLAQAGKFAKDKTLNLAGLLVGGLQGLITNTLPSTIQGAIQAGRGVFGLGSKLMHKLACPASDVYVSGSTSPALKAVGFRVGEYFDKHTGSPIKSPCKIKGPVINSDGEVVLSLDDLAKGIVDKNGKPIRSLLGKLGHFAGALGHLAINTVRGAGRKLLSAIPGLKKFGAGVAGGLRDGMGKVFSGVGSLFALHDKKNHDVLVQIRNILDKRLPSKKHAFNDENGDGIRDGSWRTRIAALNKKPVKGAIHRWGAKGKSALASAAGALGMGKKKEEEEGSSIGDDIQDAWFAKELAKSGVKGIGKAAGWLWKGGKWILRGGKAATIAAGAAEAASAVAGTGAAATAAAAGTGTMAAIGGAAAATGGAILSFLASPVVIGAVALAATAYGGYKLYKYLSRDNATKLDQVRMTQYGLTKDLKSHYHLIFALENYLQDGRISYDQATPSLITSKLSIAEIYSILGVDANNKDQTAKALSWFYKRFKPVFFTHVLALHKLDPKKKLADVNGLDKKLKQKYLDYVSFESGPYNFSISPFMDVKSLPARKADVLAAVAEAKKEFGGEGPMKTAGEKLATASAAAAAGKTAADSLNKQQKVETKSGLFLGIAKTVSQVIAKASPLGLMGYLFNKVYDNVKPVVINGVVSIGRSFGKFVTALEAIRFKSYGLTELTPVKVNSLRELEGGIAKYISFEGTGAAKFNGDVSAVLTELGRPFGVGSIKDPRAPEWVKWFNFRFLPVYLTYVGYGFKTTGKKDPFKIEESLSAADKYSIGLKISGIDAVWSINDSPWYKVYLNNNKTIINDNLTYLQEHAKDTPMREEGGKKQAVTTQMSTKGNSNSSGTNTKVSASDKTLSPAVSTGKYSLDKANPEMKKNLQAMLAEYAKTSPIPLTISNVSAVGFNMSPAEANKLEKMGLMRKYGFTRPVGGKPGYIEPAGIQAKYTEAMNNPALLNKLIDSSVGHGGGGYGTVEGAAPGKRNVAYAIESLRAANEHRAINPDALKAPAARIPPSEGRGFSGRSGYASNIASLAQKDFDRSRLGTPGSKTNATGIQNPSNPKDKAEVMRTIAEAAAAAGVDPATLTTFAALESGLNPSSKASTSNAAGAFQFIPSTWKTYIRSRGPMYGLSPNTKPTDLKASALMAAEYMKDSEHALSGVTGNITPTDLYLAHFLGPGGARTFLKADPNALGAELLPAAARANRSIFYAGGRPRTVGEIKALLHGRLVRVAKNYNTGLFTNSDKERSSAALVMASNTSSSAKLDYSPAEYKQKPSSPTTQPTPSRPAPKLIPATFSQSTPLGMGGGKRKEIPQDSYSDIRGVAPTVSNIDKTLVESLDVQKQMLAALSRIADTMDPKALKDLTAHIQGLSNPPDIKATGKKPTPVPSPAIALNRSVI